MIYGPRPLQHALDTLKIIADGLYEEFFKKEARIYLQDCKLLYLGSVIQLAEHFGFQKDNDLRVFAKLLKHITSHPPTRELRSLAIDILGLKKRAPLKYLTF